MPHHLYFLSGIAAQHRPGYRRSRVAGAPVPGQRHCLGRVRFPGQCGPHPGRGIPDGGRGVCPGPGRRKESDGKFLGPGESQ
ncbi:MAG: hypothetical protein DME25_19630, partial [Verrucomicrobia bacterium]